MEENNNLEDHHLTSDLKDFIKPLSWVERNGFSHWAMAILWIFLAVIVFQLFGIIIQLVLALFVVDDFSDPAGIMEALMERADVLLLGNSIAQIVVLASMAYIGVRLHDVKRDYSQFMRLKKVPNIGKNSLLALVLFVVAYPTVLLFGWINSFVPTPDFLKEMAEASTKMIQGLLQSENGLILGLLFIGVVPAVCEELLFRGYMFRAFEKSVKLITAILVTSFIFGLFHLDITGVLPRMFLGALLAYVTWTSDSLYPAMVGHLVNNGGIVVAASLYPQLMEMEASPDMELPWLYIIASLVFTSGLLYYMYQNRNETSHVD